MSKPWVCQKPGISARQAPAYRPSGIRCIDGVTMFQAWIRNVGTCCLDAKGADQAGNTCKVLSTNAGRRDGVIRSSAEAVVMTVERRDHVIGSWTMRQLRSRRIL